MALNRKDGLMRPMFTPARRGAIMAALLCAGTTALAPARAQIRQSLTLDGVTFALSPDELSTLAALGGIVHTSDRGAQGRALAAARSIANGRDALYLLALYQYEIGRQWHDDALR